MIQERTVLITKKISIGAYSIEPKFVDNRAKIKLEINNLTGSKIKEIKEYTNY